MDLLPSKSSKEKTKKIDFKTIRLHQIKLESERVISKVIFAENFQVLPQNEIKWQNIKESVYATLNQFKSGFLISKDVNGKELTYLTLFGPKHMIRFQQQLMISFVSFIISAPQVILFIYMYIEFKNGELCDEDTKSLCN